MSEKYNAIIIEKDIGGYKPSISIVSEFIDNLIKCGYEVFITDDEFCYIIEYNHKASEKYGNSTCMWVTDEEKEFISNNRREG